jgi:hypothetical protein
VRVVTNPLTSQICEGPSQIREAPSQIREGLHKSVRGPHIFGKKPHGRPGASQIRCKGLRVSVNESVKLPASARMRSCLKNDTHTCLENNTHRLFTSRVRVVSQTPTHSCSGRELHRFVNEDDPLTDSLTDPCLQTRSRIREALPAHSLTDP